MAVAALLAACENVSPSSDAAPPSAASPASRNPPAPQRLRVDGTRFIASDGRAFHWRGITAFRLVDHVADGQEVEAARFLDWAAERGLTVVRVLTMMSGQFELRPEDGRRALPRVLELAAARGLYVEVVAFANTVDIRVNLQEHVDAVATILAAHPNGVLEVANEPVHPSQSADVQNPSVLKSLAGRVRPEIPVSLGSIERGDGFGAGSYITWHAPRESGQGGWGHVLALASGADLLTRWKKPVVSDEPIGAGAASQPGRRDDDPARFRAAALLTRLAGLGATFHYEGGLQARVPEGRELECFSAWNEAWTLLPRDVESHGAFRSPGSIVAPNGRDRVLGVYERADAARGYVLVLGDPAISESLVNGWKALESRAIPGGRLVTVTKD